MQVVYVGPFIDGVRVPHGSGEIHAAPGEPIEVPDDLGASLLEQPTNWQPSKAAKKSTPADSGPEEGVNDE